MVFIEILALNILDLIDMLFDLQAVERGAGMDGQKITYTLIKHRLGDLFYRLV